MSSLGLGVILLWRALIPWLLRRLVASRIDGSLLISLSLPNFEFAVGLRRYLVPGPPSLFGLLAGWTLLIGLSGSSASRVVQDMWDVYREDLGSVPPDLVLALRSAFDRNCVDEFWKNWSAGAEADLLRACQRAGGPVSSGRLLWQGALQIRRRRLGGGAAGVEGPANLTGSVGEEG